MKPKTTVPRRYFMMYLTGKMDADKATRFILGYDHILNMHKIENETDEALYLRCPEIKVKLADCMAQIMEIRKREAEIAGSQL